MVIPSNGYDALKFIKNFGEKKSQQPLVLDACNGHGAMTQYMTIGGARVIAVDITGSLRFWEKSDR